MANDKDLFSDISLDGFDEKYLKRTKDALKAEKAKKTDERIREFDSRPRSLAWAKDALVFCDREETNGKDIADISDGMMELPRIRKEAQDIIRKDQEARDLALKQAEQAAKDKALAERIQATDKRIREFAALPKTVEWANEAFGFCDREEANGKDIYDYSSGLKDLPRIRREAQDVLDEDERQQEIAKEQARLAAIEKDRQAKAKAFQDRVDATDARIREFAARKKTVEWANEAFRFCDREEANGKDIVAYSSELRDLPRIRDLAKEVLENEKKRIEKEKADKAAAEKAAAEKAAADKAAAEKAAVEAAAAKAAAEKAAAKAAAEKAEAAEQEKLRTIQELDEAIETLYALQKSRYWCEELRGVEARVKKAVPAVKLKMKNLHLLDDMMRILPSVEEGTAIDEQILALSRAKKKDEAWANKALALYPQLSDGNSAFVKEQELLKRYVKEANDILRQPTVTRFERFLRGVEVGNAVNLGGEYAELKKLFPALGYSLDSYISNFSARWAAAGHSVAEANEQSVAERYERCLRSIEENRIEAWVWEFHELDKFRLNAYMGIPDHRIQDFATRWGNASVRVADYERQTADNAAKAAAAKAAAEAAVAKEKAKAEAKRQAKEKVKNFFVTSAVTLCIVAVLVALALGAILFEDYRHLFIGAAIAVLYTVFWGVIRYKSNLDQTWAYFVVNLMLVISCIPLYLNGEIARAYGCGFSLAIFLSGWVLLAKATKSPDQRRKKEAFVSLYSSFVGLVLLSVGVGLFFEGMTAAIVIAAGCFIAYLVSTLFSFAYATRKVGEWYKLNRLDEECWSGFDYITALAILVAIWWISREFTVVVMGVAAGMLLRGVLILLGKHNKQHGFVAMGTAAVVAILAVIAFFFTFPTDEEATKIENGVLVQYRGISETFVVPEEVTSIGENAFMNNQKIKKVVFHDGIVSIGAQAFFNCDSLEEIVIPDSVVTIGEKAFSSCDGFTTVTIGDGVEVIGNNAFDLCSKMTTIYIGKSVRKIGELAFHPFWSKGEEYTFIYNGTEAQWNAIDKPEDKILSLPWCYNININEIRFEPKN